MNLSVQVDTGDLEEKLYLLAKAARVAPGVVMKEETKQICQQIIKLTPPQGGLAQGRNAIKGDLFGGKRTNSARYSSVGLFQRIGSSTMEPPRSPNTETVGVNLGWEGAKRIRIMRKFWRPNASMGEMTAFHKRYQNPKTGRVGFVSQSYIGRWKVQDQMWVSDSSAGKYLRELQSRVGWAKGGWARTIIAAGGTVPGWIGRHAKAGTVVAGFGENNPHVIGINLNVKIPGYQRMVDAAVQTRVRITQRKIDRIIAGKAVNLGFATIEAR